MKSKLAAILTLTGGILLILLTIPHFFLGYPGITELLEKANASTDLLLGVQNIWIFSSITMLLCGLWGFLLGYQELKNKGRNRPQQLILGIAITLFGLVGLCHPFPSPQLGIFLVPGLLILIPGLFKIYNG